MIPSMVYVLPKVLGWMNRETGFTVATPFETLVVNTFDFVKDERRVVGTLEVSALPRVLDVILVEGSDVALQCEVEGWREKDHKSWLRMQVRGHLSLQCQRCLAPMDHELTLSHSVQLIAPGETWPDEELEDGAVVLGPDAIAADEALVLAELIEEEVLLALPIAPRHESCVPPVRIDDKQAASPFAVLAQLKKH